MVRFRAFCSVLVAFHRYYISVVGDFCKMSAPVLLDSVGKSGGPAGAA